jgi:hypothetical protein
MKITRRLCFLAFLSLWTVLASAQMQAQTPDGERFLPGAGIKTNLLYDATATFNLGVEFRTGNRTSLDIPLSYNPWTFSNNRKWKHVLVQPEFRLWTRETFDGHFFGVHGHYAFYNVGNLPKPFSPYMQAHRFEGWLAGAGVSYGYRWNFRHPRWALEATVGVGYAYMEYDKFICGKCGEMLGSETKNYFGPTKAGLSLILGLGKQTPAVPEIPMAVSVPVVIPVPEPEPPKPVVLVYEPHFAPSFVTPESEAVKARSESGRAFLDFEVGSSVIIPNFRRNAAELQCIRQTIESVRSNPDATVTGITITGWASPEGSASSNRALSERRAQALANYIGGNYGLSNGQFTVWGAGEDWPGLDSLVGSSFLPYKYFLLDIIRNTADPDAREQRLRTVGDGEPYRQMVAEFYPRLRRSDYTIAYTVVPFTVEQGREVLKTRPGDLSLNELFLIANTYPAGSESFNQVFEAAVQAFPDSDVANLNAAAIALGRKDVETAIRCLTKVRERNEPFWNNAGVLAWLQGNKAQAAEYFDRAGIAGSKNAAELRSHLESLPQGPRP